MAELRWHGDEIRRRLEAEMGKRLRACAIAVSNRAKKLLSVEGTGVANREGYVGPGQYKMFSGGTVINQTDSRKGKKKKLLYNEFPSRPGEPPHVQTGRLRASVAWEQNGMVARVGTGVVYGRHLELGTDKMAARPWLKRSLFEMVPSINIVMSRPFRG